jgi:hypothetical protein
MYYGRFYAGGRQVKRRLGPRRGDGAKTGLTRAQAERALQRLIESHASVSVVTERVDLADAAARYLVHLEEVMRRKPATLQDYEIIARRHLAPFFSGKSLDAIDTQLVGDYLAAKRREGLASNTIKNQLTFLHGVFRHAMKKGWARSNPVAAVDRPREDAVDPDIRFFEPEEVEVLQPRDALAAPDPQARGRCGKRRRRGYRMLIRSRVRPGGRGAVRLPPSRVRKRRPDR